MFPLMLIDTPDDRYRRPEGPSWRRVFRLLAGAVVCFMVGALLGGFLFQIVAAALLLLAISMLD